MRTRSRNLLKATLPLLLASCTGGPEDAPSGQENTPMDLVGEFNFQAYNSWFLPCGSAHRYPVQGPALPDLELKHATLARAGVPVKVWLSGWYVTTPGPGGYPADSALVVVEVLHLGSGQHCDPVASPQHAGRYESELPGTSAAGRMVVMDLLPNGDATLRTDLRDGRPMLEEDGTWGLNSRDQVEVIWTRRNQHQYYRFADDKLVSDQGPFSIGSVILYRTVSPPDRSTGVFAEVAALVGEAGGSMAPDDLRPSTELTTVLGATGQLDRFRTQVRERFDLPQATADRDLKAATTLGDVADLVRRQQRRGQ